jgi:hypothetical protein
MMMFDAQITVALFAAFLLVMIAGSGIEIIARGGRHSIRALTTVSADMLSMPPLPRDAGALAACP